MLQHWKKRYFVLCKPSGSLPDQYQLHYYKDEHSNKKKGSINLDQCEQVIEGLDSGVFPYLFAIKTYYKNKVSSLPPSPSPSSSCLYSNNFTASAKKTPKTFCLQVHRRYSIKRLLVINMKFAEPDRELFFFFEKLKELDNPQIF